MYNTMSINPGYTGSLGTLDAVVTYRDQWVGIDGAPTTQNLGIHSPLRNEKIGVGLNIQNDEIGPAKEFYADANFSYSLQLSPTLKMGLGLKAGAKIFNLDFSRGTFQNSGNDPLNRNIENKLTTTVGAGAYMYSDNWYLGLSVPDFITNKYYDDIEQSVAEEQIQYFLIGGYVFDLSPTLKFKPAFLAKYLDGFPLVVDVSANFLIMDQFSLGASYRYDDSFSGLAGVNFLQNFFVGYSYDYTLTDLNKYNSGTHEIVLRYTLFEKTKRINSPRYF
jgi:type IX secretion system PorP/SprF family membrane protein